MQSHNFLLLCLIFLYSFSYLNADDDGFKREKTHFKKDPRDYTDRDVDSLFEEWEVNKIRLIFSDLSMLNPRLG